MASKRKPFAMMDEDDEDIDDNLEENSDDSVSDFDDDEDPDKIEIPGFVPAIDFAPGTSGTSGNATITAPSTSSPVVNKVPVVQPVTTPVVKPVVPVRSNFGINNGAPKPMMSSLGVPILPVNTATTRVGGPTVARRGGLAGQPFTKTYSYSAGGGVKATVTAAPATAPAPLPMANVKELMMKLIADNPSFLTSGIPNDLLTQMIMTSNTALAKPTPVVQHRPVVNYHARTPGTQQNHNNQPRQIQQNQNLQPRVLMTPGDAMKVKQPTVVYNLNHEEEDPDEEEMGVAETYAEYWPAKLKLGRKHPDPVVETASLSSVEPSDITYKLSISSDVIDSGVISALQLEAVTYASQAHEHFLPDGSRAGFLIGDGAGVGKGRTIAAIIYENYLKGRKRAIWISVSNDLKYDAERDLRDIRAGKIEVHSLNKLKYAKISSVVKKGVIFSTYSALIGESQNQTGKYKSRLKQLLQWCGHDFDGCIVFDECHKAKNLCPVGSSKPTKTGLTALELQNKLPKARIVYASATGASEPRNMAYMVRLGMWNAGTAFPTFTEFIQAVEKRGVGAMEIVAMDMKLRGMYIARQLSFHGVTFRIEEVQLSPEFRKVYDKSVELWVEAMQKFTEAAELIDAESRMKKTMWGQFWSAHQRFFKYLCIAAKVNQAVTISREAIKHGKCVVIGLQSTGEARTLEQLEREDGELSDFVSTAKGVFQSLVEKHFPAPDRNRINRLLQLGGVGGKSGYQSPQGKLTAAQKRKAEADEERSRAQEKNNNSKRNRAAFQNKRSRKNSSDVSEKEESSSSSEVSEAENESEKEDSDKDSDSGGSSSSNRDSDGYQSSDFNPFGGSGSDSDADPWVKRNNRKSSEKKKKRAQDMASMAAAAIALVKKKTAERNNTAATTAPAVTATPTPPVTTTPAITVTTPLQPGMLNATINLTGNGVAGIQVKFPTMQQSPHMLRPLQLAHMPQTPKPPPGPPSKEAIERACQMKEELLSRIDKLGQRLPPNTLDQLIDELGGPENVAEMTGRKGRVVQNDDGSIQYESRSEHDVPLETLNLTEKQRFMDGKKDVAIISEAASSGISLQSDRRVRNQRRRVHITLELPWSADRAIQQFGRTHRSNQVSAPEYIFLISDLAGERRFASTVAKRLESLGALTHGDRRATETRDLSQFNIDNKYGRSALETVMKTIMGYDSPMVPPPEDYQGEFFKDVGGALVGVGLIVNSEHTPGVLSLDKDYGSISKFLNRILGMPVELQNRLFKYFTDVLAATISKAKKLGRFDMGILDLGSGGQHVTRIKLIRFTRKHATGVAPTELHTVQVERGMCWADALDRWADLPSEKEGFYLSHQVRNNKHTAILACFVDNAAALAAKKKLDGKAKKEIQVQVYRPNTGLQVRTETLAEIEKKYKKVSSEEAERHWQQQYDSSARICSHAYWRGNCRNVAMGLECDIGLRRRTYTVLSGSVLGVWSRVEQILAMKMGHHHNKMQVIRLKTKEGQKIVGTLIPKPCVEVLIEDLKKESEKVQEILD